MQKQTLFIFLSLLFLCAIQLKGQSNSTSASILDAKYRSKIDAHLEANDLDSALFYIDLVTKYHRLKDNYSGLLRSTVEKAELLRSINSIEESYRLLKEHQSLAERMDPGPIPVYFYNRLAAVAFENKKKEEAMAAVRLSQSLDSLHGDGARIYSNWNLEGAIYRDWGDMDEAKAVLVKTANYAKAQKDTGEYLSALYNMALTLFRSHEYEACRDTSLRYVQENHYPGLEKTSGEMWQLAARSSFFLGDVNRAYHYLDSAHRIRLHDMERIVESRVDAFKISGQLEQARLKNDMLEAENRGDRLQIWLLLFLLIVAVLLMIIIYLSRQRQKSQYKEQKLLNAKMQESLEFKNKLISIVAHDIRNPMASLKGMLQLYNQGAVNPDDLNEWMSGLEVSVSNVDLLLENLLNWVRSQSNKIESNIEELNLARIIQETLKGLEAQVALKKIQLELPPEGFGSSIKGDRNILSFALRNVLSNALKFSPENSKIRMAYTKSALAHFIAIEDHGSGISSDQLEAVLQQKALSKAGTAAEKGTGMGISLSMEFLEAMGGRLEIHSQIGEGTKVKIHLPLS